MHRCIAVLTRKLDNVLVTLRSCRRHYYKELSHLRTLARQQAEMGSDALRAQEDMHESYFFCPSQFQDEVTIALYYQHLRGATGELENQLRNKQTENQQLMKKVQELSVGLERFSLHDVAQFMISQMPIERSRRHATTDLFLGERQ